MQLLPQHFEHFEHFEGFELEPHNKGFVEQVLESRSLEEFLEWCDIGADNAFEIGGPTAFEVDLSAPMPTKGPIVDFLGQALADKFFSGLREISRAYATGSEVVYDESVVPWTSLLMLCPGLIYEPSTPGVVVDLLVDSRRAISAYAITALALKEGMFIHIHPRNWIIETLVGGFQSALKLLASIPETQVSETIVPPEDRLLLEQLFRQSREALAEKRDEIRN